MHEHLSYLTRFLVYWQSFVHRDAEAGFRRDPVQNQIMRRIKTAPQGHILRSFKCYWKVPELSMSTNDTATQVQSRYSHLLYQCLMFCFEAESSFVAQAVLLPLVLR